MLVKFQKHSKIFALCFFFSLIAIVFCVGIISNRPEDDSNEAQLHDTLLEQSSLTGPPLYRNLSVTSACINASTSNSYCCQTNQYWEHGKCNNCSSPIIRIIVLMLTIASVSIIVTLFSVNLWKSDSNFVTRFVGPITIIGGYFETFFFLTTAGINNPWLQDVRTAVSGLYSVIFFEFEGPLFSPQCMKQSALYVTELRLWCYGASPLIVFVVIYTMWKRLHFEPTLRRRHRRHISNKIAAYNNDPNTNIELRNPSVPRQAGIIAVKRTNPLHTLPYGTNNPIQGIHNTVSNHMKNSVSFGHAFNVGTFIILLLYPKIIKTCFNFFACVQAEDIYVLANDGNFTCFELKWFLYLILVLVQLVVYGIGIPVLLWLLMRSFMARKLSDQSVKNAILDDFYVLFGFMSKKYHNMQFSYDYIYLGRRVLVLFVGIICDAYCSSRFQIMFMTVLLFASGLIHLSTLPFRTSELNMLEAVLILITLIVCLSSMLLDTLKFSMSLADFQSYGSYIIVYGVGLGVGSLISLKVFVGTLRRSDGGLGYEASYHDLKRSIDPRLHQALLILYPLTLCAVFIIYICGEVNFFEAFVVCAFVVAASILSFLFHRMSWNNTAFNKVDVAERDGLINIYEVGEHLFTKTYRSIEYEEVREKILKPLLSSLLSNNIPLVPDEELLHYRETILPLVYQYNLRLDVDVAVALQIPNMDLSETTVLKDCTTPDQCEQAVCATPSGFPALYYAIYAKNWDLLSVLLAYVQPDTDIDATDTDKFGRNMSEFLLSLDWSDNQDFKRLYLCFVNFCSVKSVRSIENNVFLKDIEIALRSDTCVPVDLGDEEAKVLRESIKSLLNDEVFIPRPDILVALRYSIEELKQFFEKLASPSKRPRDWSVGDLIKFETHGFAAADYALVSKRWDVLELVLELSSEHVRRNCYGFNQKLVNMLWHLDWKTEDNTTVYRIISNYGAHEDQALMEQKFILKDIVYRCARANNSSNGNRKRPVFFQPQEAEALRDSIHSFVEVGLILDLDVAAALQYSFNDITGFLRKRMKTSLSPGALSPRSSRKDQESLFAKLIHSQISGYSLLYYIFQWEDWVVRLPELYEFVEGISTYGHVIEFGDTLYKCVKSFELSQTDISALYRIICCHGSSSDKLLLENRIILADILDAIKFRPSMPVPINLDAFTAESLRNSISSYVNDGVLHLSIDIVIALKYSSTEIRKYLETCENKFMMVSEFSACQFATVQENNEFIDLFTCSVLSNYSSLPIKPIFEEAKRLFGWLLELQSCSYLKDEDKTKLTVTLRIIIEKFMRTFWDFLEIPIPLDATLALQFSVGEKRKYLRELHPEPVILNPQRPPVHSDTTVTGCSPFYFACQNYNDDDKDFIQDIIIYADYFLQVSDVVWLSQYYSSFTDLEKIIQLAVEHGKFLKLRHLGLFIKDCQKRQNSRSRKPKNVWEAIWMHDIVGACDFLCRGEGFISDVYSSSSDTMIDHLEKEIKALRSYEDESTASAERMLQFLEDNLT